jgi:hypothetical protein
MTDVDEPTDDADAPVDPFDQDDADEDPAPAPSWLGAAGQMTAAVLIVLALVAAFIGIAVTFRRLFP